MKHLANIVSVIVIVGSVYGGYIELVSTLATKQDLQKAIIINNFKWAESNIKINDLQLSSMDRIKLTRELTNSESRHYNSIEKSTERIIKAQESFLEMQSIVN